MEDESFEQAEFFFLQITSDLIEVMVGGDSSVEINDNEGISSCLFSCTFSPIPHEN